MLTEQDIERIEMVPGATTQALIADWRELKAQVDRLQNKTVTTGGQMCPYKHHIIPSSVREEIETLTAERDAALKLLWRVYLAWNRGQVLNLSYAELQTIGKASLQAQKE
jgi:hypothetical protein